MHWQLVALAVVLLVLGGVLAGAAAAAVVVYAGGRRLVDDTWLQVVPLAGALLAFGFAEAIGGSGFIAAFVGGLAFSGRAHVARPSRFSAGSVPEAQLRSSSHCCCSRRSSFPARPFS